MNEYRRPQVATILQRLDEAIESWLDEAAISDAERAEIERARSEAAQVGTVEFEEFFADLLRAEG